jgi:hypothetical protein
MRSVVAIVAVFFGLSEAQAGSPQVPFHFFVTSAERIVEARVGALETRWQGELLVTDVALQPTKNLKGGNNDPFIVTIPGGTLGETTLHVSKAPKFAVGEDVVLFLRQHNWCPVLGWERGKLTVVDGRVAELNGLPLELLEADVAREMKGK